MKAVGYQHCLPIEDEKALQDLELEAPKAQGRDILVEVKAMRQGQRQDRAGRVLEPQ
jgi:hypothetical protein